MERDEIVKLLKRSKRTYLIYVMKGLHVGMCICILESNEDPNIVSIADIRSHIPEYNPEFLGGRMRIDGYWWDKYNTKARMAAFDKLIDYYSKSTLIERVLNNIKRIWRKS